jgi:hypothetical protein
MIIPATTAIVICIGTLNTIADCYCTLLYSDYATERTITLGAST